MRICILCYRANPFSGGQGIYLKEIAEALVRQGHEVHAVVGPPFPEDMKGVVTHFVDNRQYYGKKGREVLPRDSWKIFSPLDFYEFCSTRLGSFTEISTFSVRSFFLVRSIHARTPFDVIHDNQSLGFGLLLFKALGIPVTATVHHPLTIDLKSVLTRTESFIKKMKVCMFYPVIMQAVTARYLDGIVTVSRASRDMIARDYGVPGEKIRVIYNGINTSVFKKIPVKKKQGQLIFVGNCGDSNKGFDLLLASLCHVAVPWKLTVVDGGKGHRRREFLDTLNSSGFRDRVVFHDGVTAEELVQFYNESECAVSFSRFEGFGFPAGEAMACGVPVIVSDGGALPEVAGDAGITVPFGNDTKLARAIETLLSSNMLREEMGTRGVERVARMFSWKRAVQELVVFYKKLG